MPKKEVRSARISLPVTPSERKRFRSAADKAQRTLSDWLRLAAEAAAETERKARA